MVAALRTTRLHTEASFCEIAPFGLLHCTRVSVFIIIVGMDKNCKPSSCKLKWLEEWVVVGILRHVRMHTSGRVREWSVDSVGVIALAEQY